MIPLVICSIVALAVVFERILYSVEPSRSDRAFETDSSALERDRMVDASAVHKVKGQIGTLAATALASANRPREQVEVEVKMAGEREVYLLERRLPTLEMVISWRRFWACRNCPWAHQELQCLGCKSSVAGSRSPVSLES